jgi:hypothetical protein
MRYFKSNQHYTRDRIYMANDEMTHGNWLGNVKKGESATYNQLPLTAPEYIITNFIEVTNDKEFIKDLFIGNL